MIKAVLINRLTDGKIFCEASDGFSNQTIQDLKIKIKKHHKEVTPYSKTLANTIKQIQNSLFKIYYKVDTYVIFTVVVDNSYPIKLVNCYIDAIKNAFFDQAKSSFGAESMVARLESIDGDHYFVKFDKTIKAKKKQFDDPTSLKNTERLKKQLEVIQDIMKENMQHLDRRHNDLLATQQKARRLNQQSKNFHSGTKKLVWHLWIRKNMVWIVVAIFLIALYFIVF